MEDLAPLRRLIDRPDVQRITARIVPVKRFSPAPKAVETAVEPLPIPLRTRENPDGVPLGEVNALVKKRVPGVNSIIVRDHSVVVTWAEKPTDEMRAKLKAALTDEQAFQSIMDKEVREPPVDLRDKLLAP